MFSSRMDALIIAMTLSGMAGCSALNGHKTCCRVPTAPGTVRTTGVYAVSRVIPIPAEGLLLGDAVEKSVRPGVIQAVAQIGPPVTTQVDVPVTQRPPTISAFKVAFDFEADKDDPVGSFNDLSARVATFARYEGRILKDPAKLNNLLQAAIDTHVFEPAMESVRKERKKLQDQLIQEVDPLFGPPSAIAREIYTFKTTDNAATDIPALKAKIEAAAASSRRMLSTGGSADLLLAINAEMSKPGFAMGNGRDDLVKTVEALFVSPTPELFAAQPVATAASTQASNGFSSAVVVLTRRNSVRIIAPLNSVRTSVPGDIMLQDGDRIEITDFRATSASRSSNFMDGQEGEVLVSSWLSNEGLKIPTTATTTVADAISSVRAAIPAALNETPHDTIVLNRLSELGQVEQYLLPKDDPYWLHAAKLQHTDHLQLQAMELSPLIRNSRRAQLIASIPPIKAKGPLKAAASGLNSLVTCVEAQFQQFTGINKADVCKETQGAVGNVGALVTPGLR